MKKKLICLVMSLTLVFAFMLGGCSNAQSLARETVVKTSEAARVEENYKTVKGSVNVTATSKKDGTASVSKTNVDILTQKTNGEEQTDVFTYSESSGEKSLDITYLRNGKTYCWSKSYSETDEGFSSVTKNSLISERNAQTKPELVEGGESDTAQYTAIYENLMKIYEENKKAFGSVSDNFLGGVSDLFAIEATKASDGYTVTVDAKKGFNNVFETILDILDYAEKNPEMTVERSLKENNSPVKKLVQSFVGDVKAKDFITILDSLSAFGVDVPELSIEAKENESLYDYIIRLVNSTENDAGEKKSEKLTDALLGLFECKTMTEAKNQIETSKKQIDVLFPENAKIEVKLDKKYVVKSLSVDLTLDIGIIALKIDGTFDFNGEVKLTDVSVPIA